jgi:urease accessory protein
MSSRAFLLALQLGDSALPTGRFAHSYGLEELVMREPDLGEPALLEFAETMLLEVVAPLDGVAIAEAHRLVALADIAEAVALDRAVTVRKVTPSSRHASSACGRRLAALVPELTEDQSACEFARTVADGVTDGNLAIVEGVLAHAFGIGVEEAVLLELRATSAALLSAALRLGRISSSRAQILATRLVPIQCVALDVALSVPVSEMRSVGPEFDLASMCHHRRDAKLFAT